MAMFMRPTFTIESEQETIVNCARNVTSDCRTESEKIKRLFYFVRDSIRYNIFMISVFEEDFKASRVLEWGKGYCVQKAVLLCALARAVGVPSRLVLARIRNHRVPPALRARLGRNEFPGHGYNQFYIDDRWVSAAATFDAALCARIGVPVVEFDGYKDATLPAKGLDGEPYIEYLEQYGYFADLPLDFITERTSKIWGWEKRSWLRPGDDTGFP